LNGNHNRRVFECGVAPLDHYIQKQAGQGSRKRAATVFVLTADGTTIAGYYSLSQFSVWLSDLPPSMAAKLPKYPAVPATLIGRLAVDKRFRGKGTGELLLMDALARCLEVSKLVASAAVIVDAKDETAKRFYMKYGFMELPGADKRLFIPIGTVEALLSD
jgi:GNAT superfamily N-acetyltransferase